jgi:hypothetical protein
MVEVAGSLCTMLEGLPKLSFAEKEEELLDALQDVLGTFVAGPLSCPSSSPFPPSLLPYSSLPSFLPLARPRMRPPAMRCLLSLAAMVGRRQELRRQDGVQGKGHARSGSCR